MSKRSTYHEALLRDLDTLNDAQREASAHHSGPGIIIAGPGSGKTKTLVTRVARLVFEYQVAPSKILVLTFSTQATQEMRERINDVVGRHIASEITVQTIHAFCLAELRSFHKVRMNVVDCGASSNSMEAKLVRALKKSAKDINNNVINLVGHFIQKTSEVLMEVSSDQKGKPRIDWVKQHQMIMEIMSDDIVNQFLDLMVERRFLSFDIMQFELLRMLLHNDGFRQSISDKYQYIQIDEYQDTSSVQAMLLDALSVKHRNIMVVGDVDQCIYEFRNARPEIMLDFPNRWEPASQYYLDVNYRSTKKIVYLANYFVQNSSMKNNRFGDLTIKPAKVPMGSIYSREYANGDQQYLHTAYLIESMMDDPLYKDKRIAILCKQNKTLMAMECALKSYGIPSDRSFKQSKVVLSPLKLAGIVGLFQQKPSNSILEIIAHNLAEHSNHLDKSEFESSRASTATSIRQFMSLNDKTRAGDVVFDNMKEIGSNIGWITPPREFNLAGPLYTKLVKKYDTISASNIHNLGKAICRAMEDASIVEPMGAELIAKTTDTAISLLVGGASRANDLKAPRIKIKNNKNDQDDSKVVRLLTYHGSKGLEFDIVFLPDIVRTKEMGGYDKYNLSPSEFRPLYVALTRPMHELHISYVKDPAEKTIMRALPLGYPELIDHETISIWEPDPKKLNRYLDLFDAKQSK